MMKQHPKMGIYAKDSRLKVLQCVPQNYLELESIAYQALLRKNRERGGKK